MNSASLEETLAFLDEELQRPDIGIDGCAEDLSSFGGDVWDPDELLASIDNDIGDFSIESTIASDSVAVAQLQSGNTSTQDVQSSERQAKPKKKKRKQLNSNKARDERRFEVVRLRREAEDLELTLQQLKAIRSQQRHDVDSQRDGYDEEDTSGFPAVWQEICARQLDRRLRAEQENAKLKKRWEEEKRVVKSIEKMLFKRMALTGRAHPRVSKHTRRTNLPAEYIKRVAAFIFDELSASVEVSYREVEGIFAGNGLVPKNVVTHQPLLRGGMKGTYRSSSTNEWCRLHCERLAMQSFGLEMTDLKTNASATSYGQQILHRHVEENRIVFVWNAYIEPFVFENQPVSGVYILEQSHVLIKPVDPDSTSDDEKKDECFTSMSTCYVITPHFLDPNLKNDPKTTSPPAEVLAFLDEALEQPGDGAESLPPLDGIAWDPNLLLEILDNDESSTFKREADWTKRQQVQENTTKKKKPNKNKARDERRFVLIQLRDEVEKLEFTLKQLRNMRNKQQNAIEHSSQDPGKYNEVPAVWQEICARQLRQRLSAERENVRLKQELEREKQLVKSVQKLLYKRRMPKETGPEADKHTRRTNIPPGYIERMAAFIFDELAAGVETMYREVGDTLEASSSFTTGQRPLLCGGVEGKAEKLFDRKFCLLASTKQSLGDTIVETFGLEMDDFNANISASSYGQQILRRDIQDHRVMYVWNAYMEPFVFENERVSGIYFLEQCYVLIKPGGVDPMSGEDEFSSSMSTCYTITPYFLTPELRKDPKARALIDFFVSSILATMKSRSEMVENLLLDQVLEKYNLG
ncbi:hypothetical protein GQ600_16408 [Phytophthora cactorum]|nr:hypothetical protein GQ600_16408 [Phytophthora cactorum]